MAENKNNSVQSDSSLLHQFYQWTRLTFELTGEEKRVNTVLNAFAEDRTEHSDCRVNIRVTEEIKECSEYVYKDTFFGCSVKGNTEYRDYFDEEGNVYARLEDSGKDKELNLIRGYEKVPFFSLLNCLALDKTMNQYGRVLLHSSFIETSQGALLFTAPSGTGKSTQADLWKKYKGTQIINGDRTGLWKEDDTWMAGGVPWCGTSGICVNRNMPLRAVVILRQGKRNELVTVRMADKFKALMEQTTINPWNKEMYINTQNLLLDLCRSVPVYWLSCLPDREAVDILAEELGI